KPGCHPVEINNEKEKENSQAGEHPPRRGDASELTHFDAYALEIFRGIHAGAWDFLGNRNVNFLAVPQHAKLFEHLNMLQRAWCPGDVATNKAGAVAVNTDVAQEGFADCLFRLRETIAIPRNGGAGEIERVALCVHDHFHRIRIER